MRLRYYRRAQRGLATVEFAIAGTVFLVLVIAVIDIGRLLFTWNALDEVTRQAARLASVCPVTDVENVKATATFGGNLVVGLDAADLEIRYLDGTGSPLAADPANVASIRFVQARLNDNYQFQTLIPFFYRLLTPPQFSHTVIAESLGVTPVGGLGAGATISC